MRTILKENFGLSIIILLLSFSFIFFSITAIAGSTDSNDNSPWTIYYRPGVRFGTDDRTLYINDFLVPLYRGDNDIIFSNIKFTPNDQDGWEVNLGLGYRRLFWDDRLILGVNGFYDQRKTIWGSIHDQWGIGAEVMADLPIKEFNLGLTGRFNYYHPLTSAKIDTSFIEGNEFIFKGNGLFSVGGILNARIEEPIGGFDGEVG